MVTSSHLPRSPIKGSFYLSWIVIKFTSRFGMMLKKFIVKKEWQYIVGQGVKALKKITKK